MPASIGVNLRVTGHCSQGGRKYMEDFFAVAYQQTEDEKDLEYAFFGIYDGHGGGEAATYAKEHLMESIVRQKMFWSDKDEDVLKAIKEGYIATHYAMWKEQEKWPKTPSGLPSTAGTTATIAFIRRAKIFIGHVGDSGIVLGYQEPGDPNWKARSLTNDHKPEDKNEMSRIQQCGGKVITKSGVPRVVWNRPRIGHRGPVRRSTPIDEIPFLAVARSLGDLWSYNATLDEFVVSPDPDTCVVPIDTGSFRCLIFGTDGLWNMITPHTAVSIVQITEKHNEKTMFTANKGKIWINPSKSLVEHSLERWSSTKMRADNTTAVTLLLDPPGPPRSGIAKLQRRQSTENGNRTESPQTDDTNDYSNRNNNSQYPANGLHILTRYPVENNGSESVPYPVSEPIPSSSFMEPRTEPVYPTNNIFALNKNDKKQECTPTNAAGYNIRTVEKTPVKNESCAVYIREYQSDDENVDSFVKNTVRTDKLQLSNSPSITSEVCPNEFTDSQIIGQSSVSTVTEQIENIQINEVSSSSPQEMFENKKKISFKNAVKSKIDTNSPGPWTRSHNVRKPIVRSTRSRPNQSTSGDKTKSNDAHNLRNNILHNTIKRGRKRVMTDSKLNGAVKNGNYVNEKISFPIEPLNKKYKLQPCLVQMQTMQNRFAAKSKNENDENKSDQENKLNAHSLSVENMSRTTRGKSKSTCVSAETNTSESKPGCSSNQNRNLRERNIITQSNEEKQSLRSRTVAEQQRLTALAGRLNKTNSNLSNSVNKKSNISTARKTVARNLQPAMQTRNRVKQFNK